MIEPPPEAEVIEINAGWQGDSPFFLVIELDDKSIGNIGVDLDTSWHTEHAEHLRSPATWHLIHKQTQQATLVLVVEAGDQPYFTRHHVGNLMAGTELVAFGLGKKCADGSMVRLWLLPNGMICGGEDVDIIAARMLG